MIQSLGHLFIAVSSIINLNQINANLLQSSEKDSLKTNHPYSTAGNENEGNSCTIQDEDLLHKIHRLGTITFSPNMYINHVDKIEVNLRALY